ncbi:MAG: rRNA maturation RNase YbeY [Bacilli bacterium]|nr:rRNA maturation RNase YbeY [Bacilli bacterium]MDD4607796.1 rRNA maturation RNase YbeY [Bacilli bacterium]
MNNIEIYNETGKEIKELEIIKKLVDFAIEYEKLDNLVFNIIIVDNEHIRDINKNYRNIDRSTDVITFALEDNKDFPNMPYRILGDIYISLDKVEEQSKLYGHSFLRELAFLTIHGFLHLLGYDHMNSEDEKVMFSKQELILNEYGIQKNS